MGYQTFSVKGEVTFGSGCLEELPEKIISRNMKKVLITSDPGLVKTGLINRVEDMLTRHGIEYVTFTDIEPDPSYKTVEKGIQIFVNDNFDGIVGIGGGSAMDTAKGIAIVGKSGKKIKDFAGYYLPVDHPVPPVIAVPTTAGTGSEVTRNAVITDEEKYKMVILNDKILPACALLDPQLLATLPASVAAAAGMDALIHAVESYLSLAGSVFSYCMAEKAMELIGPNLRAFVANRADLEAASNMILGSAFAGIALSLALPCQAHALSHPITGYFNIPHGVANAVLFPFVLEFNALADKGKYKKIYSLIKPNAPDIDRFEPGMLVEEIRKLNKDIGLPERFSELGVTQDCIPLLLKDAQRTRIYLFVPRQTTPEDMKRLYSLAIG
ncbi:MAG: iron-containing alcohol dehydrogenase [Peptococcaceae bacterium]|jgi:alcohol dehydrogenase|nr:iron-containing alcohol dehydrogenase [Peptococcaceae bacterium]MDH7525770.1 iron-containing alcohol dehydrogenase [Peptococcaceae bacterium]